MKPLALILGLLLLALPVSATNYFISPTGNDGNNGLSSGSPWLSPLHAVNCGDTITAATGTYSANNFASGKWGAVTCGGGNNVAWIICAIFDACKISAVGQDGMRISANYWGVQGFEVTASGGACFTARPATGIVIHHIIFANDIANGCSNNGFNSFNNTTSGSVDYLVIVGNIAYNAASGSGACYSGISIYEPKESDAAAGTHIYVAGNFSYANVDASPCAGGTPTDGEGIIFDNFDFSQSGGTPYLRQAVAYNNMLLGNGGQGFETFASSTTPHATIYAEYNTAWGNANDAAMSATFCGQFVISNTLGVTVLHDLAMTSQANGCGANSVFAYYMGAGNGTDTIDSSWGYSAAGHNEGINNSPGFSYGGSMNVGTNPAFTSASTPGAPSCGSASSVPNCMATVISNFTPTAGGASAFGYQPVSNTSVTDPLFPVWLCNVNLPPGLVTPGCGASSGVVQRRR